MAGRIIGVYLAISIARIVSLAFFGGTYVLFLQSHGLDLFEVNLVNAVYFATLMVCSVPAGALADIFGRRPFTIGGCLAVAGGMTLYGISHSFEMFLLSEFTVALGTACITGSAQAWVYDELDTLGKREIFQSVSTRENAFGYLISIIPALCGGAIAQIGLSVPWFFAAGIMLLATCIAFRLMCETRPPSKRRSLRGFVRTLGEAAHIAVGSRAVLFVLACGIVYLFAVQAPNMQWQPFFEPFLSGIWQMGVVKAAIFAGLFGGACLAYVLRKVPPATMYVAIQCTAGLCIIGAQLAGVWQAALVLFVLHEIPRGMYKTVRDVYLNKNISTEQRATILSLSMMTEHLGGVAGLLATGMIAVRAPAVADGIGAAWMLSGIVLCCMPIVFFLAMRPPRPHSAVMEEADRLPAGPR